MTSNGAHPGEAGVGELERIERIELKEVDLSRMFHVKHHRGSLTRVDLRGRMTRRHIGVPNLLIWEHG